MITTVAAFLEATSLVIEVLVQAVLTETGTSLTPAQVAWFTRHCDLCFRYFHANNP